MSGFKPLCVHRPGPAHGNPSQRRFLLTGNGLIFPACAEASAGRDNSFNYEGLGLDSHTCLRLGFGMASGEGL